MKSVLLFLSTLIIAFAINAQTATNFKCDDCSGTNHDLFTEIAAGKVVVLCWVMPCGTCIGPAMTSYNIVSSYQSSHPGKINFYLIDDFANTACPSLISWANSYNMPAAPFMSVFSNASIDMLHYGSIGMPKVVVVGPGNYVYYNKNDQIDSEEMMNAIEQALTSTGIDDSEANFSGISVYPNPSSGEVKVSFFSEIVDIYIIEVTDVTGKKLQYHEFSAVSGENTFILDNDKYLSGVYFIQIKNNSDQKVLSYILNK